MFVCYCSGYLLRFSKLQRKPGDLVYILCANWFKQWMEYTGYQVGQAQWVWLSGRTGVVGVAKWSVNYRVVVVVGI